MRKKGAFTLLEVIVAATLITVLLAAAYGVLTTGRRAAHKGVKRLDRISTTGRLIEQLKSIIRFSTSVAQLSKEGDTSRWLITYCVGFEECGALEEAVVISATRSSTGQSSTTTSTLNIQLDFLDKGRHLKYELPDTTFSLVRKKRSVEIELKSTSQGDVGVNVHTPSRNWMGAP